MRLQQKVIELDFANYDIDSFETDGTDLHIEVKSTSRSKENDICFWLSANEVWFGGDDASWMVWPTSLFQADADVGWVVWARS